MSKWFQIRDVALIFIMLFSFSLVGLYLLRGGDYDKMPREIEQDNSYCEDTKGIFDINKVEMLSSEPRVFIHYDFLTEEECDAIIDMGLPNLQESMVASSKGSIRDSARTSYGAFLNEHPILSKIEERIAMWTQLPVNHGENFYFLRYEESQEYKPHYDFFDPAKAGMQQFIGDSGNRLATVLLYLGTPEEGGGTVFPRADITVPAVRGSAVLFYSMTPDNAIDRESLHGGLPVEKGIKYCATKWIRENSFARPKVI